MALIEEWVSIGNKLFTKRSYFPLILYVISTVIIFFNHENSLYFNDLYFSISCLLISLIGVFIRIITIGYVQKGTFGRNVAEQKADALNTRGIYSIVRHPLYLGNFFMWLGLIVYVGIVWYVVLVILIFWLYYERIMLAEEAFLKNKFKDIYIEWSSRTPAFIPKFSLWQSSELTFSFKNVVKREFYGLTALAISFAYLNFIMNYFYNEKVSLDLFWQVFVISSLVLFFTLRLINKKTKWL